MLDIKTLYMISVAVTLLGAGAALLTWYHHRDAPSLRAWACALLLANAGTLLLRWRGPFGSVNATLAADTLIIAGFAVVWTSQYLTNRDKFTIGRQAGITVGLCGLFMALFFVIFAAGDGQGMRSTYLLFTLFIGALSLATAWEFHRGMARDGLQSRTVVVWAFVGMAIARVVRGTVLALETTNVIDGSLSHIITGYALYATVILVLAITYGLVLMANEGAARRDQQLFAGG
ncbi:MAG: hypothetical protein EPO67_06720 [Reyranella sp.]|nr:MAG: hypothetical protein EPO67_06720 [Reyranella sp.]